MGYRHYSIELILLDHGDDDTQAEWDILQETGVGGDLNDENPKKG